MSRLRKDLGDLPRAESTGESEGYPPDTVPRFGVPLIEAWHAEEVERDARFRDLDVAGVEGARFYHSMGGACARAVAYAALRTPRSNPIDAAGHFITRQGRLLHEAWQAELIRSYEDVLGAGVRVEVAVKDGDRAGHVDAVAETSGNPPWVSVIEAKSVDGYSFKAAIGVPPAAHAPQGPKYAHKVQAFLNARALDADEAVIVYLARGAISTQAAQRHDIGNLGRVSAEWTCNRNEYEPVADREIARVEGILALLDEGTLPARKIPDPGLPSHHVITNPRKGEWMSFDKEGKLLNAGTTWHCLYCPWQDVCATAGPQREPVSRAVLG